MSDPVEQGEQVAELASVYDDVALAAMVLELRERVRLLEQRIDDLSTAEQGEIEASKTAARLLERVRLLEKELEDLAQVAYESNEREKVLEQREKDLQALVDYFEGRERHPIGCSCDQAERLLEQAGEPGDG